MLNIDLENKIEINPADLIGRMIGVLGITGSGKTNTAAVLIEELFASNLPMTIVDIEGEYYGLKTQYEILVVGRSENVDLEVSPEQAGQLAGISIGKNISLVLDVSEFDEQERFTFLLNYFKGLWEANFKVKKPYAVFVEEAHEFIPQSMTAHADLKTWITRLALRGRKRGFSVVVMSQRSAKVAKDVLTQASLVFLHQVIHPSDMAVYKELIPLPAKEVEEKVGALAPGQCLVLYKNKVTQANIRLRHTLHVGATPELGLTAPAQLKSLDKSIFAEFKKAIAAPAAAPSPVTVKPAAAPPQAGKAAQVKDDGAAFATEIKELKAQLRAKESENVGLKKRVAELEARPKVTPAKPQEAAKPTTKAVVTPINTLANGIDRRRELAVQTLVKRINAFDKHLLSMLVFLYQHEGNKYTIKELANWLLYKETTFKSNPPTKLVELGLIGRDSSGQLPKFYSNISKFFKDNFDISPDPIMDKFARML